MWEVDVASTRHFLVRKTRNCAWRIPLSLTCSRPCVKSSVPVSDLSYWLACNLCIRRVGPRWTGRTVVGHTALHTAHSRGDLLEWWPEYRLSPLGVCQASHIFSFNCDARVALVADDWIRLQYWWNDIEVGKGGTRWRSRLRHCATSRKVASSIPGGVIAIFHWMGSTQPLTEMRGVDSISTLSLPSALDGAALPARKTRYPSYRRLSWP